MRKVIGTLVPLSALFSLKDSIHDKGTFATGIIFLDWLRKTKQSAWQLLPLYQTQLEPGSTTKHIPSPYKSYGIGLDPKYLPESFAKIHPTPGEKNNFIKNNEWIRDYALFCSLRDYYKTDDWAQWDTDIKNHMPQAIAHWTNTLAQKIDIHIIIQWQLHMAYAKLKQKAKKLRIALIGDLPFYIAFQSPLVWANQDAFQIEKNGNMHYVSGTLNSHTAYFGRQIWGHPLYNWNNKEKVIAFWKTRLAYAATLFHRIRLDHAKAFFSYGALDLENSQNDQYMSGPGKSVFEELILFAQQKNLEIFIEDSGGRTQELRNTIHTLKIPGIKIFRFAFDEKKNKLIPDYAHIDNYPIHTVAYTTTHDTETLLGYLHNLTPKQKQKIAIASGIAYDLEDTTLTKKIRDKIIASPAQTIIIPIQDWLLTTDRINLPGTELPVNDPNWQFKLKIPIEHLSIF